MSQSMTYLCPHCGTGRQLTDDYLSQHGGRDTNCTSCGKPFQLPPASILSPAFASGRSPPTATAQRYRSSPVLQMFSRPEGVWQDHGFLVAADGATLPPQCVKCGEPAEIPLKRRKFQWHDPKLQVAAFFGLLPYLALSLALRKKVFVHVGLCNKHRSRRRVAIWAGLGMAALSILVMGSLARSGSLVQTESDAVSSTLLMFSVCGTFGGIIWALFAGRLLKVKKIEGRAVWLKGVHPSLIESLPSVPSVLSIGRTPYR